MANEPQMMMILNIHGLVFNRFTPIRPPCQASFLNRIAGISILPEPALAVASQFNAKARRPEGAEISRPCVSAPLRLGVEFRLLPKAPEGWRTPRRFAHLVVIGQRASVLDCGGPPPLFHRARNPHAIFKPHRHPRSSTPNRLWPGLCRWPSHLTPRHQDPKAQRFLCVPAPLRLGVEFHRLVVGDEVTESHFNFGLAIADYGFSVRDSSRRHLRVGSWQTRWVGSQNSRRMARFPDGMGQFPDRIPSHIIGMGVAPTDNCAILRHIAPNVRLIK